jgi:hypothetical protein
MFEFIVGGVVGVVSGTIAYEKVKDYKYVKNISDFKFTQTVEFNKGEFAIRRGALGIYAYKDLCCTSIWWSKSDRHFADCIGTLEDCEKVFNAEEQRKGSGTPVK